VTFKGTVKFIVHVNYTYLSKQYETLQSLKLFAFFHVWKNFTASSSFNNRSFRNFCKLCNRTNSAKTSSTPLSERNSRSAAYGQKTIVSIVYAQSRHFMALLSAMSKFNCHRPASFRILSICQGRRIWSDQES
jgi:hypothetical protein